MKELQWIELGLDKYKAETRQGVAFVELDSGKDTYSIRLELPSSEVVYHQNRIDIETAMDLARVFQPLLDQRQGRFDDCGFVEETLNLCQQLISKELDANHWQRIECIKAFIALKEGQSYEIVKISIPEFPPIEFNWIEDGSRFHVDTPYGQAIITEKRKKGVIGGNVRHDAQVKHHSGAILNCYTWVDFVEAEEAIKRNLKRLSVPGIYEDYLDNMDFTLDICQTILPEDADPIHFARLNNLGTEIHLILE